MLAPVGIVSRQHIKWLVEMTCNVQLRPTAARVERAFDTFVMEQTRPKLRTDPWPPVAQQFIVGSSAFRRNTREPRPIRCNIHRLAASGIPVLAVIPRDETLHDGPTMAERFRQQLPHAQVVLVDDANHLIVIDQPDVVSEQLQKFLGATLNSLHQS